MAPRENKGITLADLTDRTFGRWTVIKLDEVRTQDATGTKRRYWWCTCQCGRVSVSVQSCSLVRDESTGCRWCALVDRPSPKRLFYPHQVRRMRQERARGRSLENLGEEYGISASAVALIVRRKTYREVKDEDRGDEQEGRSQEAEAADRCAAE